MELEKNKLSERGITGENVDQKCGTCVHSRWQGYMEKEERFGQCLCPTPKIPSCYLATTKKRWIYKHEGKDCQCYVGKNL